MTEKKNEHLVYALGEKQDGTGWVLIIGVTDMGIETLQDKRTLTILNKFKVPITDVVVFHEKDKATLVQRFKETGLPITHEDAKGIFGLV